MSPRVPPSTEVLAEHLMRCPCASCSMYRRVVEVIEKGTPDERLRLLGGVVSLLEMLSDAVGKDLAG